MAFDEELKAAVVIDTRHAEVVTVANDAVITEGGDARPVDLRISEKRVDRGSGREVDRREDRGSGYRRDRVEELAAGHRMGSPVVTEEAPMIERGDPADRFT